MYELEIRISDFGSKTLKTEDDFMKFFKLCKKKYPKIDYSGIASLGLEIKYIRKIETIEILKDIENMLDIFKEKCIFKRIFNLSEEKFDELLNTN